MRRLDTRIFASVYTIGIAIVLVLGALWAFGQHSALENRLGLKSELDAIRESQRLVIDETDQVVGNPTAKVAVVEYFDLECPYCKQYQERRPYFEGRFKDRDVVFVSRHFPLEYLHKQAPEEAIALECAAMLKGPDGFFPFRDMVYANTEGDDTLDLARLSEFAALLKIPEEDFKTCRESEEAARRVSDDIVNGAIVGIYSTPSFALYKNGEYQYTITGGSSIGWLNMEAAIEHLLTE
jgi:protein-disulfide isomerase